MKWVVYAIIGLLMAIFAYLLWLMLKDAKPTHHRSGWGGGHGTNINHTLFQKDKDD